MENRFRQIPVLLYHNLSRHRTPYLTSVSGKNFVQQIEWLAESGYRAVTFTDIISRRALPEKPVIITFDDGYETIFRLAFPLMKEANFRAVVFLIAGYMGKYNRWDIQIGNKLKHLDRCQIRKLVENGWEIGSHGYSHRSFPLLNQRELELELTLSRKELQACFGEEQVRAIAYPFGHWNSRVIRSTAKAGYRVGLTVRPDTSHIFNPFLLSRIPVYDSDHRHSFERKIEKRDLPLQAQIKRRLISFPANFVPFYQYLCRRQLILDN